MPEASFRKDLYKRRPTMECPTTPRQAMPILRPRERLAGSGPSALSDLDLLALILSPGTRETPAEALALNVLRECGGLHGITSRRLSELAKIKGMGIAKASRLVACAELTRRLLKPKTLGETLKSPDDVFRHAAPYALEQDEVFVAISLNTRNRVLGEWVIARGWESGINLTTRQVFSFLLKESVYRVIFVHNHPSMDPEPSAEDINFTSRLIEAGRCLDIKVLDHVIVCPERHVSLRERLQGRLPFA